MQLQDYRRPKDDNGRGIHFVPHPYATGDGFQRWLNLVVAMKMKWLTMLNLDRDALVRCKAVGIQPVVRPFIRANEDWIKVAGDVHVLILWMLELGLGPYVQIYNEPELAVEWPGSAVDKDGFIWRFIWAAEQVYSHGGYPGIQVLDPEWLRDLLRAIKSVGKEYLFDRIWFGCHNYMSNHPPEYDEDVFSMLAPLWFDKVFQQEIGYSVPCICTEGGWAIGDAADARYGPITPEQHRDYTVAMFEMFRTGIMPNGQPLPDWWFAVTPWLLASVAAGGGSDFENNAWYSQWFGERTLTIEAVKALPEPTGPEPAPEPTEPEEVSSTMPEFHFGFKDLHDANPDVVGEAMSEQIDIPGVMSLQFTEKGLLVYREGAGAKFIAQVLPNA